MYVSLFLQLIAQLKHRHDVGEPVILERKGMWYQVHDCNSMTQPPIDLPTSDDARHNFLYRFAKQAEP